VIGARGGNVIDSLWIALGFKPDTSGLRGFRKEMSGLREEMLGIGGMLKGMGAAIAGGFAIHKVAEIGSQFEQNKNQIAGFLTALGLAGDFNQGLEEAARIINKITHDAAVLPGEAEEYVEVFKSNAAFLKQGMPGANADEIAGFTNKMTAVAKSVASTLDSAQIAREAGMLLAVHGRAGGHNVLWNKLLPFMMQVEGQANITAESFNAMTQPQRVELLNKTFAKLQPTLDAAAGSYDAMMGALTSSVKQIVRLGTEGLFTEMKDQLAALNAEFFDADGNLTKTGKDVVGVLKDVSRVVGRLLHDGVGLVKWVARMTAHSKAFRGALLGVALILGGLPLLLAAVVEDFVGFLNGEESITGELVDGWGPALYLVIGAIALLAAAVAPVPAMIAAIGAAVVVMSEHWQEVLDFVQGGLNGWVNLLDYVIDKINKLLGFLGMSEISKISGFTFADEYRDRKYNSMLPAGEGVLAPTMGPATGWGMTGAQFYSPAAGMSGPTTNNVETHVGPVTIVTNDPKRMGREFDKHVRDGQSPVGL
jgi:hypothetical protein